MASKKRAMSAPKRAKLAADNAKFQPVKGKFGTCRVWACLPGGTGVGGYHTLAEVKSGRADPVEFDVGLSGMPRPEVTDDMLRSKTIRVVGPYVLVYWPTITLRT